MKIHEHVYSAPNANIHYWRSFNEIALLAELFILESLTRFGVTHLSPRFSLLSIAIFCGSAKGKGLREFIKMRTASRRFAYQMLFYSLLFFLFLLGFVFVLTAVGSIDDKNKCSTTD
ncbi:polygalacturonate 4-alpha-galacturonosyltransferase [Trifolium repens]|nr:polygalacturonate 4-alpha-galacturonosyltransferase [Trifolium repens]